LNKLKTQIEVLLYENTPNFKIATLLKQDIQAYFTTLEKSFSTSGGKDFLVKHTKKIDSILKLVYKVAFSEMFGDYAPMKNSIPLGLIALGSYGREQLCVHSDIDLMIVYKEIPGYNIKEMIEKILYILWDTGLKLGHRVHTVEELFAVSKTDITIKTALIESRFIEGSHFIWVETENLLSQIRHDDVERFIQLKLQEQHQKHTKFPLTMEPNLKEGVGGFRDANLVFWVGKILYNVNSIKDLPTTIIEERAYRTFRIALEFLFRVRSALHLVSHKKEDRLRLELIPEIAHLLGYAPDRMGQMKLARKVTESLKVIRLYSRIWLDRLTRPYQITEQPLTYLYDEGDKQKPFHTLLHYLSQHAQHPFKAHATLLERLINAPKPDRLDHTLFPLIKEIFYQPSSYSILHTLSYVRLLRYTIPPIKKVVDLPQFDGYHQFAVDIHSLHALRHLESIQDPFILSLFEALTDDEKALIKLVTFLHDAGKGRKRDHHGVGASLFKVFATKLHLDPLHIKLGEQLILHHTLMSNMAQREDLENEKTILKFAAHFKSKKELDLIYLLTYADMQGVGEGVYTTFNAKLLKTLYHHALESLAHTEILNETAKRIKKEQALQRTSLFLALSKSQQKKILQIPSNLLFLRYSPEEIVAISQRALQLKNYEFQLLNQAHLTIEIIRKESLNLGYLLAKLSNLEVLNMDIYQLFDTYKYFRIDFKERVTEADLPFIEEHIHHAFRTQERGVLQKPAIPKEALSIDCNHSKNYAAMHLNCKNQKALLAYIIDIFDALDIDIATAKIHTLKNRVRDMFLIQKNGNFCHNTDKIIQKITER